MHWDVSTELYSHYAHSSGTVHSHKLGPLESLLPGLLGGGIGPRSTFQSGPGMRPSHIRISSRGPMGPRPGPGVPGGPQHLGMDQAALENALQVCSLIRTISKSTI